MPFQSPHNRNHCKRIKREAVAPVELPKQQRHDRFGHRLSAHPVQNATFC